MGWRGTIVLVGLVIAVGAYLWLADAPTTPAEKPGAMPRPPSAESGHALRKLLVFEPADVVDIELQRAGQTHAVQRRDDAWQGAENPVDVTDFLHTLAEMGVLMDISASSKELADYGLDPPLGIIVLHLSGGAQPLVLQIGERNPATTGVYVRIGADGPVALAGALVEWEFDKLFKHLSHGG